ncbi:hypothetical protein FJT64_020783 [Amphibalanus amphitrite]|uniref:Integrase p58-like C-terminal domain-containing protein n=1 Tax=Amphibalanus amphitrite TaxID=1232801 RepID=A0A6A4WKL9_AMPAM|nr:hypothetical protein FJT64_020783 [Amphibalanus amphitrite]
MALPAITGRAFDFAMRLSDGDRNSWKKLCEKLNAEFDSPGLAVQYALEFHQRIRRPGESLATFLYDLETLCARAYPEWEDATYRQRLVKDRFLMGIGEKSRKHILSFYQPTWSTETVLLEARKLEQIETSTGGGASVGAVHGAPRGEQSDAWSTGSQPQPSETSVLSALSDKIQMLEEQMQACRVFRPSRDYNRSSRSVNTECVLGNDFLSLYGEVALDFVHMTMRLTENSTADRRVTGGRSLGERAVVHGGPAAVAAMESRDAGGPAAAGAPATDGHPVELTADVTIPAASEVLLAGRVRADTACAPGQHITLVEDSKFTRRYGNSLCVSSSVDVIRTDSAVQLRLCNPGRSAVKLYKSCTVARCVGYADPPTVRASPLSDLSREEREARERQLEDMVRSKVAESDVTDEQRRALAAVLLRRNGAFSVRGEIASRLQELDELRHEVKEKVESSRRAYRQKQTVRFSQHAPGDLVMVSNLNRKVGVSPKLSNKWIGPFEVLQLKSEVTYREREVDGRRRSMIVHHDRLRACPVRPDRLLSEDCSSDAGTLAPVLPAPAPARRADETRLDSFVDLAVEDLRHGAVPDGSHGPRAAEDEPTEEPTESETCSPPQLNRYPLRNRIEPDRLTYTKM